MIVDAYDEAARGAWDALVATSFNGTFLHSRRFLSYHGDRFVDRSLLIRDGGGRLIGVLPAAVNPSDTAEIVSHPGITYGGLVHGRRLVAGTVLRALECVLECYRTRGLRRLIYRPVPAVFQTVPSDDDLYALFRLGSVRTRCDLSAAIDLHRRPPVSARRTRRLEDAGQRGLVLGHDPDSLAEFWPILATNLAERHGKTPVHSLEEITALVARCPRDIAFVSARLAGELVAGAVLFTTRRTVHTQYLAATELGKELGALDCIIEQSIAQSTRGGYAYFSFGISTDEAGLVLNEGLQAFKLKFGAGSIVHETYTIVM